MPVTTDELDMMRKALAICTNVPELAEAAAAGLRSKVPVHVARAAAHLIPKAQASTDWIAGRDDRPLLAATLLVACDILNELDPPADEVPLSHRRDQVIQIRLSAAELEAIRRWSSAAGQTMSEYARDRLMGDGLNARQREALVHVFGHVLGVAQPGSAEEESARRLRADLAATFPFLTIHLEAEHAW